MLANLSLLIGLSLVVVMLTRLLVRGIEILAAAGAMSAKAKGQFLGYATSTPELVGTVGTAGHGLLGAGLWNVASSNIINLLLFISAALYFKRVGALCQRKFLDELAFAVLAFAVPLVLARQMALARSAWTAAVLFVGFVAYLMADRRLNPNPPKSVAASEPSRVPRSKGRAAAYVAAGVLGIVATGHYLGEVAAVVVLQLGVSEWAVGWLLGCITSLPEMTAFFVVFAAARAHAAGGEDADCQENLDSLAASNMSNLGLIYPIGICVFLLVGT